MSTPFPAIRAPLRESWQSTAPDGVRRTRMDAGPVKARLDSSDPGAPDSVTFRLDDVDAGLLLAHYADNKAERFDLDHWIYGACAAMYAGPIRWSKRGIFRIAAVDFVLYGVAGF